jgi:hypothetical protein
MACANAGTLRYKFQDQLMRGSSRTTFSHMSHIRRALDQSIPATLESSVSTVATRLISIWEVDDLRYDISVYGDYFQFIPRRLGTSPVLDAATKAFVCAYPAVHMGQPSTEALTAYGTALHVLGRTLRHPTQKYEPSTLISLHLIQSVQSWIYEPAGPYADHTVAIAHLLPAMLAQDWTDPIDRLLLRISATLLVVVSTGNSTIPLPVESLRQFLQKWSAPRPYSIRDGPQVETLALDRMLSIPIWSREPRKHTVEMRIYYQQVLIDLAVLQDRVKMLLPDGIPDGQPNEVAVKLSKQHGIMLIKTYAQVQVGCALGLAVAIFLNAILRATDDPFHQDLSLAIEAERLHEDVLCVAEDMKAFLPLYASGVSMSLACAYAVENDPNRVQRLGQLLKVYDRNVRSCSLVEGGAFLKRYLFKLRQEAVALAARENHAATLREYGVQESYAEPEVDEQDSRCIIL